ncbi:MAG: T9SS type A sorting domain-containing protein [Candidatus Poribacteria bacterium]|nr:T9SS type A sorting domain-containing protein [Candidatus Poribacteria bacterium]
MSDGQNLTLSASPQQLSEVGLDEGVVTLSLQGGTYVNFRWTIANALTVSGIPGVTIGTLGVAWFGVERVSDTEIEVELGFDGNIDTDSTLTFTVGAGAIEAYDGPALTAQVSVTVSAEQVPAADVPNPPQQETAPEDTTDTFEYIQGPWLWMIAEGSDIDTDYLSTVSNNAVSEALVSTNGVKSGDALGDLQWTPEVIPSSVHCATEWVFIVPVYRCKSNNVQHVVNATGLSAVQDLNYYTAYAFMNIISPQDQAVKMGVGSDDAIKVWLNGVVVHRNNADRKTSGIQDKFDVNLEAENNPLLVKVNDNTENWGMFFKIYLEPTEYQTSIYMTDELPAVAADVNEDGQVDIDDLILVIRALGQTTPVNPRVDVNSDGSVDKTDLLIIVDNLDDSAIPAAPARREAFAAVSPETLQMWLNLLRASDDGSVVYHKTLAILQGLLAVAHPHETALLSNYPNPFNPETWIPYHLSKDAEVTLRIYALNGQVVRTLVLGYQAAGIYQSRSRAAYWDGRNAFGEPVASGLYFYTLTAGDFTATRKMLIRK